MASGERVYCKNRNVLIYDTGEREYTITNEFAGDHMIVYVSELGMFQRNLDKATIERVKQLILDQKLFEEIPVVFDWSSGKSARMVNHQPHDPEELLREARMVVENGDWRAPRDRGILWSGKGNREAAEVFAQFDIAAKDSRNHAWCRIEDTEAGRRLRALIPFEKREALGISRQNFERLWDDASARYALKLVGNVRTFVQGARPDGAFRRIEQERVLRSPTVSALNSREKHTISRLAEERKQLAGRDSETSGRAVHDAAFTAIVEAERHIREGIRAQSVPVKAGRRDRGRYGR
jgi:hypothetical protein